MNNLIIGSRFFYKNETIELVEIKDIEYGQRGAGIRYLNPNVNYSKKHTTRQKNVYLIN